MTGAVTEGVATDTTEPGSAERPVRVPFLEDHEVVRRGVRDLLEAEGDLEIAGGAAAATRTDPTRCPPERDGSPR